MNKFLPFFIGFRYSKSKRHNFFISLISFISIAGIALSVCVLITVLSVMNGFDEEIEQKIYNMTPQVLVVKDKFDLSEAYELREQVIDGKLVVAAAPYITGQGVIKQKDAFKPILLNGIIPEEDKHVANLYTRMLAGSSDELEKGKFNVIISDKLAFELDLTMGDKLALMVPSFNVNPFGVFPRSKRFTISGIFSSVGGLGYDHNFIYLNLFDAQTLLGMENNISGLRLKTSNLYVAPKVSQELQNKLPDEYATLDWTEQFGTYVKAIKLEKTMMLLILVLLIVIAVFNLISSLVMLVNEKQMDIAILRTMGARPSTILGIFIVQGSVAGIFGTLLGLCSGVILAINVSAFVDFLLHILNLKYLLSSVYFVDHLPSKLLMSDLVMISSISLGLSLLATIYPAWSASRLHPVATLRYE